MCPRKEILHRQQHETHSDTQKKLQEAATSREDAIIFLHRSIFVAYTLPGTCYMICAAACMYRTVPIVASHIYLRPTESFKKILTLCVCVMYLEVLVS